jgi:glycerol uptake facilitator-like aquaporin
MNRKLWAEGLGTCILVMAVVGSGIMAANLSPDNDAVALLANAIATGAILYVLISIFGPISGAHFNPAVSLAFAMNQQIGWQQATIFVLVQTTGGMIGMLLAHAMFDLPLIQVSTHIRTGTAQWLSEGIATFGLILTIFGGVKYRPTAMPALVSLYIISAYWFTASTSFANPAVTLARSFTDTFSGISLSNSPMFIVIQTVSAMVAAIALPRLFHD